MNGKTVVIEEIRGCEGNCLTINDKRIAGPKPWGGGCVTRNWVADADDIVNALKIDAVPVVRCKDCKHLGFKGLCDGVCNKKMVGIVNPDDFCSYGERRDGE